MRPLARLLPPLTLALLAFAVAADLPVTLDPPYVTIEAALLDETNEARVRHGLATLAFDPGLAGAARAHAAEMAELHYFSHNSPIPQNATLSDRLARAGVPSVSAAENLALLRGQQDLAAAAVEGWLNSPGHRAALLHGEYTHVGFGVSTGEGDETFIAQVFARQPRRLVEAKAVREARSGFELSVTVDVPRRVTVLPRVAGSTGEPQLLEAGVRSLSLHVASPEMQQLVLATALDNGGRFVIQDGGWVTPKSGSWQSDPGMPRSALEIAGVVVRPAQGEVVRLELEYGGSGPSLAVFVDGMHYRGAEVAPGVLLVYLPAGRRTQLRVGELSGSLVTPFHEFTVLPGPLGPRLLAGSVH